jgi:tRNA threonylcarbamoyl adenosine modification protein YeaZ
VQLLAVATHGSVGSISSAEIADGRILSQETVQWDKKAMHSELATVQLQRLLKQRNLSFDQLTHIAVNVGPGSFTGIRVGINLSRTLAYALGIPVFCLNSLEVSAAKSLQPGQSALVAQKAIQNYYYTAAFEMTSSGLVERLSPRSVTDTELGVLKQSATKVLIDCETDSLDLIQWLARWPKGKSFFSWKDVKPLYIRGSEAEEKLRKGILKPL